MDRPIITAAMILAAQKAELEHYGQYYETGASIVVTSAPVMKKILEAALNEQIKAQSPDAA